jgi:hypothetical protein
MPQNDNYTLHIDDTTTILIDHNQLPSDFKNLTPQKQELVARKAVQDHIKMIENASKPATFADFAIPVAILFILSLLILWIAKKIRDNPKVYDNVVKMDGEANPEYGQGWKKK